MERFRRTFNDFNDAFTFLTSKPLPPKTQAAVYQILASLPGVRTTGSVTLPGGETGTGIGIPEGPGSVYKLVFDKNNRLIGDQEPSSLGAGRTQLASDSVLTNGWTNDSPQPPA